MREILYFQAGSVSNYVGTHFWNAQESYFTYGEDAVESIVDHDISFREGITENVRVHTDFFILTLKPYR